MTAIDRLHVAFPTILILAALVSGAPDRVSAQSLQVLDIGLESGFQDTTLGHHKRARACIAADFDLDGYIDFYVGNPGDESLVMRNVEGPNNSRRFVLHQVLLVGDIAWAGVAFDYDNDGDYDLFITCGGNETIGFDYLFRNDWILNGSETGILSFTDVTDEAGVAGPVPDGETEPIETASANAVVADYDQDGDGDIFVSGNISPRSLPQYPELIGRNTLWRNNGDGTFTDVTVTCGLSVSLAPTRHSTFLDFDNDGDADLYENNFGERNILWRNNGDRTFTDVTTDISAPGHDLGEPIGSFASGAADFNNDGWEDIIAFMRGGTLGPGSHPSGFTDFDCGGALPPPAELLLDNNRTLEPALYPDGHALFINEGGVQFANQVSTTILNEMYIGENGVMGCMVGDINNDGTPDVYVGNGGPPIGMVDRWFVSVPGTFGDLVYENLTSLIDFPAQIPDGFPVPPYPYRTHGTCFVDIDNDGQLELAVANGGPGGDNIDTREPNRLFKITPTTPANFFNVLAVGNGETVSLDAVGTRISLQVSKEGGPPWTIYKTLFAGSCFSAQNGFQLHFGLADADSIETMNIKWPDGSSSIVSGSLPVNHSIVVTLDSTGNILVTSVIPVAEDAERPVQFTLDQNYPNPFNPSTTIRYTTNTDDHVSIIVYDLLGKHVATLVNEFQPAGTWIATWGGKNDAGRPVASGVYLYRINAAGHGAFRKMVLTR